MKNCTVYVVDDDASVRDSVCYLMESVGLRVLGFDAASEFLDRYQSDGPACLILDLRMPDVSGLEVQELLQQRDIHIPVIIMTGHGDVPAAVRAMKYGALDFLEKPCSDQVLLERVQKAIKIDQARIAEESELCKLGDSLNKLSARETDVMQHIVAGKSNKETAQLLGVSPKTIESHRASLMRKLGVSSLAGLIRLDLDYKNMAINGNNPPGL